MMRNSHRKGAFRLAALGVAAAVVLGLAAPALAGEERPTRKPAVKTPAESLMAAIDSRGKLRQPTAEEAQQLLAGLRSMTKSAPANLPVEYWADGSMSVDLSGTFEHIWVAYVGAEGSLQNACIESPDQAAALLNPAPVAEEK
ncbi:MAG TPA: hypothetical protein VG477_10435 [Thermoanaerobaculia bacterium]|nr:hypothetical protein [Thermoanaerobaculia bacterium]